MPSPPSSFPEEEGDNDRRGGLSTCSSPVKDVKTRVARNLRGTAQNQARVLENKENVHLKQIDQLRAENASLRGKNDKLRAENASVRGENDKLRAENASLRGENDKLRAENASLRGKNDKLRAENASVRGENDKLRAENASLRGKNDKLRAENASVRGENEALNKKVAELELFSTLCESPVQPTGDINASATEDVSFPANGSGPIPSTPITYKPNDIVMGMPGYFDLIGDYSPLSAIGNASELSAELKALADDDFANNFDLENENN